MNFPGSTIPGAQLDAIGWSLVHFIWQGALLAVALALALKAMRQSTATARYAAACLTLALMAVAPMATFMALDGAQPARQSAIQPAFEKRLLEATSSSQGFGPLQLTVAPEQGALAIMPFLVAAWFAGVLFCLARLAGGSLWLEGVRRRARRSEELVELCNRISQRLGFRKQVCVLETAAVRSPCVLGWLRAVILSPPASSMGLTSGQLEALMAHEMAHLRRHDYLANLAQSVIESLLFYHPAVWWVSGRIREERENCCDDAAIRAVGNRLSYARALAALEQNRRRAQWAPAANGGELMKRVYRILGVPPARTGGGALWLAAGALAGVVGLGLVAAEIRASANDADRFAPIRIVQADEPGRFADPFDENERVVERGIRQSAAEGSLQEREGAEKPQSGATDRRRAFVAGARERASQLRDALREERQKVRRSMRGSGQSESASTTSDEVRKLVAEVQGELRELRPEIQDIVREALAAAKEGVASIKDPKDREEAQREVEKALKEAIPEVEKGLAEAMREIETVGPEIERALAEAMREHPERAPLIANALKSSLGVLPSLKPMIRDTVREALRSVRAQMPEIRKAVAEAVAEANKQKQKGDKEKSKEKLDKEKAPEPPSAP